MTEETLAYIDAPHFRAGIILQHGQVVMAADVIRYMKRWSRSRVAAYCKTKGWKIEIISPRERV